MTATTGSSTFAQPWRKQPEVMSAAADVKYFQDAIAKRTKQITDAAFTAPSAMLDKIAPTLNTQLTQRASQLADIEESQKAISKGLRSLELARDIKAERLQLSNLARQAAESADLNASHLFMPVATLGVAGMGAQGWMNHLNPEQETHGPTNVISNAFRTSRSPISEAVSPEYNAIVDHIKRNKALYGTALAASLPLAYHMYRQPSLDELKTRGRV